MESQEDIDSANSCRLKKISSIAKNLRKMGNNKALSSHSPEKVDYQREPIRYRSSLDNYSKRVDDIKESPYHSINFDSSRQF